MIKYLKVQVNLALLRLLRILFEINLKENNPYSKNKGCFLVAGAGLEPTTFGL